jgi:hypothetical protein
MTRMTRLAPIAAALLLSSGALAQSEAEVAKANNPLAPVNAINLQNYYIGSLYGLPNETSNAFLIRPVVATESMIIRATLPVTTVPAGGGNSKSGLGDLNVFNAFLLTSSESSTQIGVGPLVVIPTATNDALGSGKWQAGGAVVVAASLAPNLLVVGLVTYQTSFAGDSDRESTSVLVAQPNAIFQVGGGWYLRSTGVWNFDLKNGNWSIPFGVGAGKVMKSGTALLNLFVEPQFTVAHHGVGQPAFQLFAGINLQFPK